MGLLPPHLLIAVLTVVLHELPELALTFDQGDGHWEEGWTHQIPIQRLDLAAQFVLPSTIAPFVRDQLSARTGRGRPTTHQYQKGDGWTLEHTTTTAGKDMVYDKSAESRLDTPGVYRFETRLRKPRLVKHDLRALADVNEAAAQRALRARWEATRWGEPLMAPAPLGNVLANVAKPDRTPVLGYLYAASIGDFTAFPDREKRRLRSLAESAGLKEGVPPIYALGESIRIDLASGRTEPAEGKADLPQRGTKGEGGDSPPHLGETELSTSTAS